MILMSFAPQTRSVDTIVFAARWEGRFGALENAGGRMFVSVITLPEH